ncbi:LexA family protein [Acinetobacter bereziniae]|uniref:LexA family protein n=1 Tax=Acinetobacter bereziniae TaxID=106648 RepID=UPI0029539E46|nr:S24 family peptidase [Acinetobacter bereziniae]MDV8155621.1 S24 family peptidase [Acinetobacter bereziniae]
MSSVADRIQEKMSELGLKHKDLVNATGASKGAVSHWLSGVNTPSGERLLSLARLLKATPDWILTGKESKQGISNKIEHESNVSFISTPLREIPLLDYVQAGLFHDVGYDGINPIGSSWTTYIGAKPECVFSLKVEGLSMSPTFMPGDELVVDGSLEAKPGSLVIAQEVQHSIARTTFKKYRVIGVNEFGVDIIELVPLNPDFPTLNSLQIDISIIGVVVRHNREV